MESQLFREQKSFNAMEEKSIYPNIWKPREEEEYAQDRRPLLKDCKSILCFLSSLGWQRIQADHLKWEPLFPVAVAGEDVLGSGLPVDEFLAAAAPTTAKPSKLTHSGSERGGGGGEGYPALP